MITYMQNSHLKNRRAVVEITQEVLRSCIPVLMDAGFNIVGSATSRGLPLDCIRLVVEGDALPPECDASRDGLLSVRFTFVLEQYGLQRLVRISEVHVVGSGERIAA